MHKDYSLYSMLKLKNTAIIDNHVHFFWFVT